MSVSFVVFICGGDVCSMVFFKVFCDYGGVYCCVPPISKPCILKYTRARKSEWWEMKAEELQRAADRNDMKGFYSGLKEVWGPQTKQPVHLKSSDGLEIFTDSKSVMARWSEYFQKLLNVPGDIEPEVLENIQKRSVNTALDEKPTMDEMVRAIKGLKDGKAPGGDGIPAEVWKYRGANLSNRLHRWIIKVWEEGHVPQA